MDIGEAKELLKEMQENCKSKTIYKDEKVEAKAEAIEVVLKELDKKDKVIDLMAEKLVKVPDNAKNVQEAQIILALNQHLKERKEFVKQYFYKKVEDETIQD